MTRAGPAPRSFPGLIAHQGRYEAISFWKNPQSRFFTLLLPIIFLVIFATVIGGTTTTPSGTRVKIATYYVPGIATLAIIAASFVNLAVSIVTQRESGILKRRRAAPVPAACLIIGRAAVAVAVSLVMVAVLIILGRVAFDVPLPTSTLPGVILASMVGAIAFCCLAFAASIFISTADAAQPVLQFITLPLYFISGVFIPDAKNPAWLRDIANIFPVRHLAQAMLTAFDPASPSPGIAWHHILIVAAWGAAGFLIAIRRFAWTPR